MKSSITKTSEAKQACKAGTNAQNFSPQVRYTRRTFLPYVLSVAKQACKVGTDA